MFCLHCRTYNIKLLFLLTRTPHDVAGAALHSILFYISWSGALIDHVLIDLDVSFNFIVSSSKEFSVTAVLSRNWTVPCLWSHCWNCPDHGLSTYKRKMNEKKKRKRLLVVKSCMHSLKNTAKDISVYACILSKLLIQETIKQSSLLLSGLEVTYKR